MSQFASSYLSEKKEFIIKSKLRETEYLKSYAGIGHNDTRHRTNSFHKWQMQINKR